jgi:putative Holliday junction resolvase
MAGRILGLDAGDRRIGVAISDPDRSFALPLRSVLVDGHEVEALRDLVTGEDVGEIVVGLPLSLSGDDSAQTQRVREFAAGLEGALALPVHLWDERLSSFEAGRLATDAGARSRGRRGRARQQPSPVDTDALAASIILQAYLDRLRFQRDT